VTGVAVRTGAGPASWAAAARAAAADLAPVLPGLVPLGLVVGIVVAGADLGALVGVGGGLAIFAGTAQLSAVSLLDSGAGPLAVLLSVAVINARLVMYAAALEPRFRDQPRWFRWLGPHFLVDQTFALATARDGLDDPVRFRRYWLALGSLLALAWAGLIGVGMAAGPTVAVAGPALLFAPAALFVSLLVPRLTGRPDLAAAATAAAAASVLTATGAVPAGTGVLVGAAAGVAVAAYLERRAS
jgi:predicted branched-subunit amino acid permease